MNKKNLLLIAGLIILLVVFFFAKKKEHIETEFDFLNIDSLSVKTINLTTAEDTLVISKLDNEWWITEPIKAEIDKKRINTFFADVVDIKVPINPMSENPNSHSNYHVADNQGYDVKLINNSGKIIADFKVGEGSNYSYSYIRKTGANKVYQVKKNIFQTCKPTLSMWRSGMIYDFSKEDITRISVSRQDTSFEMIRSEIENGEQWTYKDATEEFVVDRLNKALLKFSNLNLGLRSRVYYDNKWDELKKYFEEPLATVVFYLRDGTQKTIYFAKNEEDNQFMIKKGSYTDTIYQATSDTFGRISFSKEQFKEKDR